MTIWLSATTYATGVVRIGRQAAMKHPRKTKRELKVTVCISDKHSPSASRQHGKLPSVNVTAIKTTARLSQRSFADSMGVPEGTMRNSEQGRRRPSGLAKMLLALQAKRPDPVAERYPQPQPWSRRAPARPDPNMIAAEDRLAEVGQILATGVMGIGQMPAAV
jgi:DNA-binding transcriptional regulator YiaG